ncbi:MAG: sulfatase-like hydrolase/transferase, partial [Spirochaetales bacterium]|nr:sulfatase-like hydrolase/transferase [Spirochaetales bacterium]
MWASHNQHRKTKPNVILIMTDDQGYGDCSCTGNPWLATPSIDAFVDSGVRLENFHVSPLCSPTRAALLTGRHCRSVGVRGCNSDENLLSTDALTIANVMSENGYATGIFGKWHLGDNYPFRPIDRGFQEAVVHCNGAVTTVPDHWANSYFNDVYLHNGAKQRYEGYCTDVWFREALRFISESQDQPFFCYLATNAPH